MQQPIWYVALAAAVMKLTLGLFLFLSYPQGVFESSDSLEYHQLAVNLTEHKAFSRSPLLPLEPETIRTPGYPVMISSLYEVIGVHPFGVIPVQVVLSTVTILAAASIASILFHPQAGLLAAILLAADPLSTYYAQVMLTETLFCTALTLCVLCLVYAFKSPSYRYPIAAGLCLVVATYTRPTSYYLGAVFPLILLFVVGRSRGWQQASASSAVMLAVYVLLVGGWQVRNYVQTGSLEFSQAKNQYLLIAHAAAIVAHRDGLSLQLAQERVAQEHDASLPSDFPRSSPTRIFESQGRFAQAIITSHPDLFFWTILKGVMANLFSPSNLAHLFGLDNVALREAFLQRDFARFTPLQWSMALSSWLYGVAFLMLLYYGVTVFVRREGIVRGDVALLVLTVVYVIVLSSGPEAYSRFRAPIMPLLCVLAAGGLRSSAAAIFTHAELSSIQRCASWPRTTGLS
jgi:4-amino-4-deoxy-L-arabinose transferase-like glycosyltransferase